MARYPRRWKRLAATGTIRSIGRVYPSSGGGSLAGAHPHRDRLVRREKPPAASLVGKMGQTATPRAKVIATAFPTLLRLDIGRFPDAGRAARAASRTLACDRRVEPGSRHKTWCRRSSRSCQTGVQIAVVVRSHPRPDYDFRRVVFLPPIYGPAPIPPPPRDLSILRQRGHEARSLVSFLRTARWVRSERPSARSE